MYKCNTSNNEFDRANERSVDAGGIRDTGVIGKAMVTFIGFCPHCSSRDFVRVGKKVEAIKKVDQSAKGVLIGSWIGG